MFPLLAAALRARCGLRFVAIVGLIAISITARAANDVSPEAPAETTYTVGVLDDNPPFSFRDSDGTIKGFAVDLLAAVERQSHLRLVRKVGSTAEINGAFERGELDILQSYVPNEQRLAFAHFSTPYLRMTGVIFARRGETAITRLPDLRDRRVFVHKGSIGERLLHDQGLGAAIVQVGSVEEGFRRLEAGEGDATLASLVTGMTLIERAGLRHIEPVGDPIPGYLVNYSFAIRRGLDALYSSVDEALVLLERPDKSGLSPKQRIYDKWFGFIDPRFNTTQIAVAISIGLALALVVALWAMQHQRRLRHQIAAQARELQASAQRYRTVFESTLHGLLVFERDRQRDAWILEHVNTEARRILGPAAVEGGGRGFDESHPAEQELGRCLATALDAEVPEPFECELHRTDGPLWVDVAVSRLGEYGRLVALRDITATKLATERLRQTEAQLRQNQKLEAIGTLASGIAHDFNNILTAISGNLELIRLDLPADHAITPALQEIGQAAERARFLVRQILTFSRKAESRRSVVSVTPLVKETLRFVSATAPSTLTFHHRILDRSPDVEVDPTHLHQALMNLCTNAVHAMRGRTGGIEIIEQVVHVGRDDNHRPEGLGTGEHLLLSVRDAGTGMSPEVMQHIFEPFFTTKPAGEGTGLGLAVVHGIVKASQGAVTVESTPGQGTTVRLYLPAAQRARTSDPREDEPAPRGNGEHILLVDDEAAIVQAGRTLLERLGYRVHACTRPLDALTEFEQRRGAFDLVVTDLAMPQMNGIDFATRVRAAQPSLPVILMSGFVSDRDAALARARGIAHIAEKPLNVASFGRTIASCLAANRPPASR